MIFNSLSYLYFYVIFLIIYWGTWSKLSLSLRNLLVLGASYYFYGSWDPRFLGLIVISSVVDFCVGHALSKTEGETKRKVFLIISLFVNLGMLGIFKYFNFFIDSFVRLSQALSIPASISTLEIILPVGISFYTFQTLSYTIDIYRKKLSPTRDFIAFLSFVAFFPQLVAGPIERAGKLLPQFLKLQQFDQGQVIGGFRLILWGFFKKIVIADNLAPIVDQIFSNPDFQNPLLLLLGGILFAFQIYGDFSGYSDIAIGTARTLGFNLSTNFRTPYFAKSLTEFWQRWHISLSTWFRDYVYIPLGGNQVSAVRWGVNIMLTFLLSGLWHGANFAFLIWGFLHGLTLILEKKGAGIFSFSKSRFLGGMAMLGTFLLVSIFWIPFRAGSDAVFFNLIIQSIEKPLSLSPIPALIDLGIGLTKSYYFLLTFLFFILLEWKIGKRDFDLFLRTKPTILRYGIYYLLLGLILFMGNFDLKPSFLYFQF